MKYLSIGTTQIFKDLMLDIKNQDNAKFSGGIWATEQNEKFDNYNPWIDYILSNPHILFHKNLISNGELSGVLITLKSNAKIFNLIKRNDLEFLKQKYSNGNGWINFELLSQDYDGIYINLFSLQRELEDRDLEGIRTFAVNSLNIFNIDAISYYQEIKVIIDKELIFNRYEIPNYKIIVDDNKKTILASSPLCTQVIGNIINYLKSHNLELSASNFNLVKQLFQEEIKNAISELTDSKNDLNLEDLLIRKCFTSI